MWLVMYCTFDHRMFLKRPCCSTTNSKGSWKTTTTWSVIKDNWIPTLAKHNSPFLFGGRDSVKTFKMHSLKKIGRLRVEWGSSAFKPLTLALHTDPLVTSSKERRLDLAWSSHVCIAMFSLFPFKECPPYNITHVSALFFFIIKIIK